MCTSLPAETCASSAVATRHALFSVSQYSLAATLSSGQAFRWENQSGLWEGVVGPHWVRLRQEPEGIRAETAEEIASWAWLAEYLQVEVALERVLAEFPNEPSMQLAVRSCRGLRLLRQDPWECLASFILSSTKQIVQIQQIVRTLCERYGEPLRVPPGVSPAFTFPGPERLAQLSEAELRGCKMGFRAPYLRAAATAVASGRLDLAALASAEAGQARAALLELPGVGEKIANCVLLFAYGFQESFPVDVWVMKALQQLYFPTRRVQLKTLVRFSKTHFGPYAGYAQQYLFHYIRTRGTSRDLAHSRSTPAV